MKGLIKMDILFAIIVILMLALFLQKPLAKIFIVDDDIRYVNVEEHIDKLTALKNNLNAVEQMITDVQICTPHERATAFKLYMHTNNTAVNILADNASENVLALLNEERRKLRSALSVEIKKIHDTCHGNVHKNVDIFKKIDKGEC
jgi:hypothetical protein